VENQTTFHVPVLDDAALSYLVTDRNGVYVDATVGGGGHAGRILECLGGRGLLVGFDRDEDAVSSSQTRLLKYGDRARILRGNFADLKDMLNRLGISNVSGVLLDLGVSSYQLDKEGRGFSFQRDERIDMRMDRRQESDGWSVVNRYSQGALSDILHGYGEEKFARRIARLIVKRRTTKTIDTTGDLAGIVRSAVGQRHAQKSLARVFQAIRIEVNRELDNLQSALSGAVEHLLIGGRIVVISYHSLEDRIVKDFFRKEAATTVPSGTKLLPDRPKEARLRVLTKKPVVPARAEVRINPRARSAKLRAAERI